MNSLGGSSLALAIIQIIVVIWDFLTIPFYFLFQRPWIEQSKKGKQRARIISHEADQVTARALPMLCSVKDELKANKEEINTMERLFKYCVQKHGYRPCLGTREVLGEEDEKQPNGKVFTKLQLGDYSWSAYVDVQARADQLGKGLREIGLKPKDKVVLYANTGADWMTTSIACFKHSLAVVTIYTNLGEEGVAHGITQTDASVVIVSQELVPRLMNVLDQAPTVHSVIIIPNHRPTAKPDSKQIQYYNIEDVISLGSRSSAVSAPPEPEDTAIIMYTSGSTGVPKGVVLTHANIVQALYCILPTVCEAVGPSGPSDSYVAYLPLAHILEYLAENAMILVGIPVGYATTNTLLDTGSMVAKGCKGDVTTLRPTVMCAVPLVLDRIYKGLQAGVKKKGAFTTKLVDFCYNYRLTWTRRGYKTPIMDRLIFKNLRGIVGGQLRVLLSGGAPLAPDAHDYCRTVLGVTLLQGYGLTETAATATIPDSHDFSTGRVGPPLQEVDIKLVNWDEGGYTVMDQQGPRGEIVIGGGHVAKEYYAMPDQTKAEFFNQDGKRWFRTGDIGHLFPDGTIKIIDRKKDLVKLQGGEYVSLGKVESLLKIHSLIENICVYGNPEQSFPVCLLVPDQAALADLAQQHGKGTLDREELCQDPTIKQQVLKIVQTHGASQKLAKFEIPQAVFLVCEPWTPESGLVTAAMKLKRKSIQSAFQDQIHEMYVVNGNNNNNNNNLKKPAKA